MKRNDVAAKMYIGRFEIRGTLGSGAQAVVYLGYDPKLDREVAIKSLPPAKTESQRERIAVLLQEARTIGKLQHPNTVGIFEADQANDSAYLVLEYVKGQLLSEFTKPGKQIFPQIAVNYISQLLDGLGYIHQCGVIHGDIKPGNIIIDDRNVPKIMDFGISELEHIGEDLPETKLSGTPAYMAPEILSSGKLSRVADIYALGVVFYMMLTGQKPVTGNSVTEIFRNAVSGEISPPSVLNPAIDKQLDAIVMKSLARNPAQRYADASAMQRDLANYRVSAASSSKTGEDTTNDVLRKIRKKRDFPALSKRIVDLGSLFGNDPDIREVVAIISRDMALANKLLRVVNSAFYSNAGGAIETISHAVVMLGFRTVREIASSLTVIDHVGTGAAADLVRTHTINSLFSALLAQKLADRTGYEDLEEIFLCAMFHRLGWLVTAFYLPDECGQVMELINQGVDEGLAAEQILKLPLTALGQEIARDWCLPEQIVRSMESPDCLGRSEPQGQVEQLQIIASFANAATDAIAGSEAESFKGALQALLDRYGASYQISLEELTGAIVSSRTEFLDFATLAKINPGDCPLSRHLTSWSDNIFVGNFASGGTVEMPVAAKPAVAVADSEMTIEALPKLIKATNLIARELEAGGAPKKALSRLIMALCSEGEFDRALLCAVRTKQSLLRTLGGWGSEKEGFIAQFSSAPLTANDLFGQILLGEQAQQITYSLDQLNNGKMQPPDWYKPNSRAKEICVLPVTCGSRTLAVFFAETGKQHKYGGADLRALNYLTQVAGKALSQLLSKPN